MIIPAVSRRYRNEEEVVQAIAERVGGVLRGFCDENGYPFVGRSKTAVSIAEKIESGRFPRWSELDDFYASSIVIPTLRHEAKVLEFLRSKFVERELRARGSTQKSPDIFRFDATRFIATLRPPPGLDGFEPLYLLRFEVQVRTAFEHAWSAATHDLVYKSGSVNWKRLRMAAQLKAAVEQLDTLVLAFESSSELITEHPSPDISSKVAVISKFRSLCDQGVIPTDAEPKDWSRFAENFTGMVRAGVRVAKQALPAKIDAALDVVSGELRKLGKQFPKSISLLQLVFGILVQAAWLEQPLQKYSAVVTPELIDLFPEVKSVAGTFDFDK